MILKSHWRWYMIAMNDSWIDKNIYKSPIFVNHQTIIGYKSLLIRTEPKFETKLNRPCFIEGYNLDRRTVVAASILGGSWEVVSTGTPLLVSSSFFSSSFFSSSFFDLDFFGFFSLGSSASSCTYKMKTTFKPE